MRDEGDEGDEEVRVEEGRRRGVHSTIIANDGKAVVRGGR